MYKTGGLDNTDDDNKYLEADDVTYVFNDKFKIMLRDAMIDWGTFLEIYNNNLTYTQIFDQVIKLLNIKENENLREFMIPLLEKIYKLPASAHIASMLKQFTIYEPISVAIHGLFTTIKTHYEFIVELFIAERNKYILQHKLKDKLNNIANLKKYWNEIDVQYSLNSSSVILLFLNPPNGLKSKLNFNISDNKINIEKLKDSIHKFHYLGYCPKVPRIRLKAILEFPLKEFIICIKSINPNVVLPNYSYVETETKKYLANMPISPIVDDTIVRKELPSNITDNIGKAKWFVDEIFELRKGLVKYGALYEEFYYNQAKIFIQINDLFKRELLNYE